MKRGDINFESLPKAVASLFDELDEIKALILKGAGNGDFDKLFTIDETAEFLHVKKQTLYSYVSKGLIPYHKRAGRLYFSKNDLIEWIKEGNKRQYDVEEEAKKIIDRRNKRGGGHE